MIAPSAVAAYLERTLRDSSKYKKWSLSRLRRRVARKCPGYLYQSGLEPRGHQYASIYLGHKYDRWLFLLDLGSGKTAISLHILGQRPKDYKRALILVPNVTNIGSWIDQTREHAPQLSIGGITGTRVSREVVFTGKDRLVAITYAGLLSFVCTRQIVGFKLIKGVKTPVRKMKVDPKRVAFVLKHFDAMVCDEISSAKNHLSVTAKALRTLSSRMRLVYGLTGTPFGRDLSDLWMQFFIVDGGETFGPTLGLYRAAFFTAKQKFFGGAEYIFKAKLKPQLKRMMRNRSIRYAEREYRADMPKNVFTTLGCDFSAQADDLYDKLAEQLHEQRKDHRLAEQSFIRMRQLCGGFVVMKGEVEGADEKIEVPLVENPKLELLVSKIKEAPESSQIVVFNQFKLTGQMIEERLKKEGIACVKLAGGAKDPIAVVRGFTSNPKMRVLIASSAGALGLNLQCANITFFYDQPTDPITRLQMERRTSRTGQTKVCYYYDLVYKDSVDEKILSFAEEARALLADVLDDAKPVAGVDGQGDFLKMLLAGKIDLRRPKAVSTPLA